MSPSFKGEGDLISSEHPYRTKNNSDEDSMVMSLVDEFVNAWNKHDAKLFSALFVDEAEWTDVFGVLMNSKQEIEKMHAYPFTTVVKDAVLKVNSVRIKGIRPDVISVDLTWESTGGRTPDGKPLPTRNGLINMILVMIDGSGSKWKIIVGHNTEYNPVLTLKDRNKVVNG